MLSLVKNDLQMKEHIERIITNYGLTDAIKSGKVKSDGYNNDVISSDEFCDWVGGVNIKNLLYSNESLEKKRFKTEEYADVRFVYYSFLVLWQRERV
jgi:hypothetical protein